MVASYAALVLSSLWQLISNYYCKVAVCPKAVQLSRIPAGVILMNHTWLHTWYTPGQECMISEHNPSLWRSNSSHADVSQMCSSLNSGGDATFAKLIAHPKGRDVCCTQDLPLTDRGFDWVLEGHEDGRKTPVIDLLFALSKRNMSLITVGDSTNGQVFEALIAEMKRENIEGTLKHDVINDRNWYKKTMTNKLCASIKTPECVEASFSWTPPKNYRNSDHKLYTVYAYHILLWYFDDTEAATADLVIPQLASHDHSSGVVVIANIGHHLDYIRGKQDSSFLYTRTSLFLNWLHRLQQTNSKNIVFFRESTPSHFPSRIDEKDSLDINGSFTFSKWMLSDYADYDYLKPNTWDHTMYYCNATVHQLRENNFMRDLLSSWGMQNTEVKILPIFKYLSPFYTLKFGHCGITERISDLDCVHYCGFSPPMWIPVWQELLKQVQLQLNSTENNAAEIKQKTVGKKKGINFDNSSSLLSNFIRVKSFFYPSKDVRILALRIPKKKYEDGPVYLLYHGLKRYVPSWEYLITHVDLDVSVLDRNAISFLSQRELSRIPSGHTPVPGDGNIIKYNNPWNRKEKITEHVFMWYIEGNVRRALPRTWNHNDLSMRNTPWIETISMPIKEIKRMPIGRPLVPPDGYLVRCDELKSGIHQIVNGELRFIPDWDTFRAMGYNPRRILQLTAKDFLRIDKGKEFPKLDFVEIEK